MHANIRAAEESAQLLKVELEQAKNEISKEKRKAQTRADEAEREQVAANDRVRAEIAKRAEAERDRTEANDRARRLEAEMHERRQKLRGGLVGSDKWLVRPITLVNSH
jgi:hypothetical protein